MPIWSFKTLFTLPKGIERHLPIHILQFARATYRTCVVLTLRGPMPLNRERKVVQGYCKALLRRAKSCPSSTLIPQSIHASSPPVHSHRQRAPAHPTPSASALNMQRQCHKPTTPLRANRVRGRWSERSYRACGKHAPVKRHGHSSCALWRSLDGIVFVRQILNFHPEMSSIESTEAVSSPESLFPLGSGGLLDLTWTGRVRGTPALQDFTYLGGRPACRAQTK